LRGADEVRDAGRLPVYRLLDHVTKRVIDYAMSLGKPQHPGLRGRVDGEFTWPVLTPGPLFRATFPDRVRPEVLPDIQSLAPYGFPQGLLDAWASSIPSLNRLQLDALNDFDLLGGQHLVVSAPTSSGKTMIGELAALKGALERKRSFFLLPLKALVNDKLRHFNGVYGTFGIRTIKATGDSTTDDMVPLMRGQYDVCLMTYEKFAALVLGSPHILDQVATVVVDEVQMITDASRGVNLEFLLTLLRMRRRQDVEPQIIALSAVIGDTNGLERWLDARILRRTERPVPLDEGIIRSDGSFRFISSDKSEEQVIKSFVRPEFRKGSSQDYIIPLVRTLTSEGKRVIIFREKRGEARGCALYLASSLGLPPAEAALQRLPTGDPSTATGRLREALEGGVAFHISDLDPEERQLVEEEFRAKDSPLKAIAATTTLAMGVNTPAEAVVIAGLMHPDKTPYSVANYKNIAGRASRLGLAERGTSFLLALDANTEHHYWTHYVMGEPEDLVSRFLAEGTDPRSLVVRVLVAAQKLGQGLNAQEMVNFLEESFGAFQQKQARPQWSWDRARLTEALNSLRSHGLIEADGEGIYHLTALGRLAGEAGVEVESIIRLVGAFGAITPESINDPTLIAATQLTVELDNMLFPINKRSTLKEPQTWSAEIQRQGVPYGILRAMQRSVREDNQATLRAKKTVACLLWITDRPLAEIEEILTQFGGKFDGAAGPVRGVRARTCDLLPTVARVAEVLHPGLDLRERVARLLARLEVGVPAAVIDLASIAGNRLARGDYHNMLKAGLGSIEAIEKSPDEELRALLGDAEKLRVVREAVETYRERERELAPVSPILPPYEG
jgi:helicase